MNIQQIEYVIAVADLKNFGQAAQRCHITQSTLSTMVARFEDEIGISIFDRKTKPVTITREGKEVIEQLKVISKELCNLEEVVNSLKGEVRGEIKIGVIPTVGPYLLPLFLKDFVNEFPNVQFEISELTTEKIVASIAKRELDIGIVSISLNNPRLLEFPLYNEPFYLYDSESSEDSGNCRVQEIDFNRLWLLEEGHCMRAQVENICGLHKKQRTVERNLHYRSSTIDTLLKFVDRNGGTTLLPFLATLDLKSTKRKHLKCFDSPVPARCVGLIVHEHFVKKHILEWLQVSIRNKVIPLIGKHSISPRVVPP